MSKAFKCDRCGKCFDPASIGKDEFITINGYFVQDTDSYLANRYKILGEESHLCPDCTRDVRKFMNVGKSHAYISTSLLNKVINSYRLQISKLEKELKAEREREKVRVENKKLSDNIIVPPNDISYLKYFQGGYRTGDTDGDEYFILREGDSSQRKDEPKKDVED